MHHKECVAIVWVKNRHEVVVFLAMPHRDV